MKDEISGRHKVPPEELDAVAKGETWERKVDEISDLITGAETVRDGAGCLS